MVNGMGGHWPLWNVPKLSHGGMAKWHCNNELNFHFEKIVVARACICGVCVTLRNGMSAAVCQVFDWVGDGWRDWIGDDDVDYESVDWWGVSVNAHQEIENVTFRRAICVVDERNEQNERNERMDRWMDADGCVWVTRMVSFIIWYYFNQTQLWNYELIWALSWHIWWYYGISAETSII